MTCRICLDPASPDTHSACIDALFDRPARLTMPMASPDAIRLAETMVDKMSVSGVQPKLSIVVDTDTGELRPVERGGTHLLKPVPLPTPWPHIAVNEHVTMRLAALVGIDVPPCATVELSDGTRAYLVRRFDRAPSPAPDHALDKYLCEDFCQALGWPTADKELGTAEICADLVARASCDRRRDLPALFRRFAFIWWAGCNDMHLKNFSLLDSGPGESGAFTDRLRPIGHSRLSPAYDLVSTALYPNHSPKLILSVNDKHDHPRGGEDDRLYFDDWRDLATRFGLIPMERDLILEDITGRLDDARALIAASALPKDMKTAYSRLLDRRSRRMYAKKPSTRP